MSASRKIKKACLITCVVLLCYPFVELVTPLNISGNPYGIWRKQKPGVLNVNTWMKGRFQENFQKFCNDNIGLYTFFIRLHNQLEYDLFGNVHTGSVHKGKENYLYELTYLIAYAGKDFIGVEEINTRAAMIKAFQDSLARQNKPFLFCISANKPIYYPEYLPMPIKRDTSNYRFVVDAFDELGVNYLDCNPWFGKMKDTMGHLLYPQYGIHWSHYGTLLVADSLAGLYNQQGQWQLPHLDITSVEPAEKTRYYDNDIAKAMNLFKVIEPEQKMVYPTYNWTGGADSAQKLLVIGDSFYWDFFLNNGFSGGCFEEVTFMYYNMTAYQNTKRPDEVELQPLARHFNVGDLIAEHDAVLFLSNEPSLAEMGWGFAEDALAYFADPKTETPFRGNDKLEENCRKKPDWKRAIQKAAEKRQISTDSMINIYLYDRSYSPFITEPGGE